MQGLADGCHLCSVFTTHFRTGTAEPAPISAGSTDQGDGFAPYFEKLFLGHFAFWYRLPYLPVQAFHLIGQHHSPLEIRFQHC